MKFNKNLFSKARIELSLWYVGVIILITGSLSILFYMRTVGVIEAEFGRIENRLEREDFRLPRHPGARLQFLESNLETAKKGLGRQLLIINLLVGVITGGISYFLSGKTLKPIEKSLKEQRRFVSDAAHELRTPVTSLRTSMEVDLRDKKAGKNFRKIIKENLEDVLGLESLIERLLKLSGRDEGVINKEMVSIKKVMEKAVKIVLPLANKKKIKIVLTKISGDWKIRGESGELIELFVILLDNAVKYGKNGGFVKVKCLKQGSSFKFVVADNGQGIAKHHLAHIFDRFYRVDKARTGKGFGLGLCLAKEIVEEYQGRIQVESEKGKGSEFIVTFYS